MATYPGAVVAFPTHNTGDTVQAADVNTPNAEIVAVETGLLNGFQHNLMPSTDLGQTLGTNAQRFAFPTGTVIAPSINLGDTGTGFYRGGANNLDVAINGSQAVVFNPNGLQVLIGFDLFTTQWQDYSGTSTIVGWASFTNKQIFYKRLGSLVLIGFDLNGTSNSTSVTFTLPYAANATNMKAAIVPAVALDNGSSIAQPGLLQLPAGSSTVQIFTSSGGGAWTASGTKEVTGQFFYQV